MTKEVRRSEIRLCEAENMRNHTKMGNISIVSAEKSMV